DRESLEKRPAILVIGSPNVGKRTLISRLLDVGFEDESSASSDLLVRGWTINTKYYTADAAIFIANLGEGFSVVNSTTISNVVALVMVFDASDVSSLVALKDWVKYNDIRKFDILLCVVNKVDLVSGHPAHSEYRRNLRNHGGFEMNSDMEFSDYGISETEGCGLLQEEEGTWCLDYKTLCLEWCLENSIEFVEACGSNSEFDRCLSVNGDSQGVDRIYGALSAHMWPGMVLKSGDRIHAPSLPEYEDSSEEENDYAPEYKVLLSPGSSAESFNDDDDEDDVRWMTGAATSYVSTSDQAGKSEKDGSITANEASTSKPPVSHGGGDEDVEEAYDFEDLEMLMGEIGSMRNGLRLMPDFQRREMAAKLAMKMAAMFGSEDEEE
ncbi:hypothetical protein M569_02586, partial [Genlisea aurea]